MVLWVWWCVGVGVCVCVFFFQAEDGIRGVAESRGLGDVYRVQHQSLEAAVVAAGPPVARGGDFLRAGGGSFLVAGVGLDGGSKGAVGGGEAGSGEGGGDKQEEKRE